jgi:hypothetical protein
MAAPSARFSRRISLLRLSTHHHHHVRQERRHHRRQWQGLCAHYHARAHSAEGPQVARLLARRLEPTHTVTAVIRDVAQSAAVDEAGAKAFVLSLEDDPVEKFAELFEGYDVVYFSAGAGGKGGEERTRKVDYEGALKVRLLYSFLPMGM